LYALLLRLYPAGFRRAYGAEAAELVRARARDESGLLPRLRLLLDLVMDLGSTSLCGWRGSTPLLARADGTPRFEVIDSHRPRPEALALGILASLLVGASFTLAFQPRAVPNALAYVSKRSLAQSPAFERISITPARAASPRAMRMRVMPGGDLHASAVPVILLLHLAYDVPLNPSPRFSGLPVWRETYDIEAKAPATAISADLPAQEQRQRRQRMVRGMLTERFGLVMRLEQTRMPVYALTVAKGGPTLEKSPVSETDCVFDTSSPESCHNFVAGRGHPLNARAVDLDDLALYIENWTDLPVVNRTGVKGLFAVQTEGWRPMRLPPPPPGMPAASFDDLPTIFTVLGGLGLELTRQEATVPVYTVERIERPAGQ
jgi:uncharacterized protein (TIGR03435 family)